MVGWPSDRELAVLALIFLGVAFVLGAGCMYGCERLSKYHVHIERMVGS